MKFSITQYTDTGSEKKAVLVQNISDELQNFLKNKNYGEDIETFYISFLGVKTKTGFEDLYKAKKPNYVDYKLIKNRFTGLMMEIVKEYGYDIKFDHELYDEFVNSSDEESKKLLGREIIKSFSYLDKLPKKLKDFDKEKFKIDVENFFKEVGII
ncbi:hypothetical protein [Sphingobacterium athyrii]|uniref:Uncharacterized protein n=1 Tax=Sphingobacterium athyrii TaxID=2152717 RepID=A0A363NUC5_9SPHI|nr:hypothetical protein [Sphingobacterium athyrii]PUV24415.1 hypothetical protein DCO56_13805 [Sphingobacterium athyrii]